MIKAALVVGVVLASPALGAECENEVLSRWRSEFRDDPAFAGLFVEADGRSATLRYVGGQHDFDRLAPSARVVLSNVVQPVHVNGRTDAVSMYGATIFPKSVQFSLRELQEAEFAVCEAFEREEIVGSVFVDIQLNRVVVEADSPPKTVDLKSAVFAVKPYRAFEATLDLRAYRRPITAGTQVLFAGVSPTSETCTLGFIAKQGATYASLAASHCTPQLFSVPIFPPELRQNGWTAFDGIGAELIDPPSNCTPTPCRRTDTVAASVAGSYSFGTVAVPTMLSNLVNMACTTGTCSETIWGSTYWLVTPVAPLQAGAIVEHVGRTSGRVQGQWVGKTFTSLTLTSSRHGSYRVGRSNIVHVLSTQAWADGDAVAWPGDSGGSVIQWTPPGAYTPLGILFGSRTGLHALNEPPEFRYSDLGDVALDIGAFSVY